MAASKILPQPRARRFKGNRTRLVDSIRDALYASKIVSYTQGMELLRSGSTAYKWNLNLSDIATIWRGGCIIRAKFLNRIVQAYKRDAALHNLLLDRYFTRIVKKAQRNWRVAVSTAIKHGVAVPRFPHRWLTSIVIVRRVCRQTSCRRNAISSARILTNALIGQAFFTPNGSNRRRNQPKDLPSQKYPSHITQESNATVPIAPLAGGLR